MNKKLIIIASITIFVGAIGIAQNTEEDSYNTKFIQKKAEQSIDFYALGNEPFWSLDMDFEKEFHFKNIDGLSIIVPAEKGVKARDTVITRYISVNDTYELIIQIQRQDCSDTMSDNKFEHKVTIDYKEITEKDYRKLSGCGNFVQDYRLHNIWAVENINNKNLKEIEFMKSQPFIEINMAENRISGHDGCNNFMGRIRYEKGYLVIGNLIGTRMACPNMDISNEISKVLSDKKLTYKFKDRKLYFIDRDRTVMSLKNID